MRIRQRTNAILIHVPCKVNLYLEVLTKRSDGFHEIETLMATAGVYDTLEFEPLTTSDLNFECRWGAGYQVLGEAYLKRRSDADLFGPLPLSPENLAWRALDLFRRESGSALGARVTLVKRIPAAAGLGGASADAAAALVAANLGWNLHWGSQRLAAIAAQLGSDVPFFLGKMAAICRGRGELVEEVPQLRSRPVVIVRPPTGLSTPLVYRNCQPNSRPKKSAEACVAAWNGPDSGVREGMVNRLGGAAASVMPIVSQVAEKLLHCDLLASQMSGSGSSFVGVARSWRQARRIAGRLRCMGIGSAEAAACPAEV